MSDSERFLIEILVEARNQAGQVLRAVGQEADKLAAQLKGAEKASDSFDRHLEQLDRQAVKARDTLRSMNPTLDSLSKRLVGVREGADAASGGLDKMARRLEKANAALESTAKFAQSLERHLQKLDAKLAELGARKANPKVDIETTKAEAKVDALLTKLAAVSRGRYTAKTDVEIGAAERKIEALREELRRAGFGDRADNLLLQIGIDEDRAAKGKLAELKASADAVARRRDVAFSIKGDQYIKADLTDLARRIEELRKKDIGVDALLKSKDFDARYLDLKRKIYELAGIKVSPKVNLGLKEFETQRLLVEEELLRLGLKRTHVKVILDVDRTPIQRLDQFFQGLSKLEDVHNASFSKLLSAAIAVAFTFAEPLLSAITGVVGGLVAVVAAAGQAAAGLVGLASAAAAQAVPALGQLFFAFQRIQAVAKAVQLLYQQQMQAQQQDLSLTQARLSALDSLKSAQEGLLRAQQGVVTAQIALNQARRDGVRQITDLMLAEQRSNLTARNSQLALAAAVGGGQGSIIEAQLQSRSDTIGASRARVDLNRARSLGVENLPAVRSARIGLEQAVVGVGAAQRQLAAAERQVETSAQRVTSSANSFLIAYRQLTNAEKTLFGALHNSNNTGLLDLFQNNLASPVRKTTDIIIESVARLVREITRLLLDPKIGAAFTSLAKSLASVVDSITRSFKNGTVASTLEFFTKAAAGSVPKVAKIFGDLLQLFLAIAKAATGPLSTALNLVAGFLDKLVGKAQSKNGQSSLAKFFNDALKPMQAFAHLVGAIVNLFLALIGPGGAASEGTRGINALAEAINDAAKYVRDNGEAVHKFFHDAISVAGQVLNVIVAIAASLVKAFDPGSVHAFAQFIIQFVLPGLVQAVQVLGLLAKILIGVVNLLPGGPTTFRILIAMLLLKVAATETLGRIGDLGSAILGLYTKARKIDSIASAFDGMGRSIGGAISALGQLIGKIPGLSRLGDAISGVGGKWKATAAEADAAAGAEARATAGGVVPGVPGGGSTTSAARGAEKGAAVGGAEAVAGGASGGVAVGLATRVLSLLGPTMIGVGAGVLARHFIDSIENKSGAGRYGLPTGGGFGSFLRQLDTGFTGDPDSRIAQFGDKLQKLGPIAQASGRDLRSLRDEASHLALVVQGTDLSGFAKNLQAFAQTADQELRKRVAPAFSELADAAGGSLRGIKAEVFKAMFTIRETMGTQSDQARGAMSQAFMLAAADVKASMQAGVISTKTGLDLMHQYVVRALKILGLNEAQASAMADHNTLQPQANRTPGLANTPGGSFATGGFVGYAGERGRDVVPAMLGRGEAVLNFAHQRIVEPALNAVYGFGLDTMFRRTRGEHASGGTGYASGGFIGGLPSIVSLAGVHDGVKNAAADIMQHFPGLIITSATGGQHAKGSYHYLGEALDLGGPSDIMRRAASYITTSGLYRKLAEGIHNPNLSIKDGTSVDPSFWGAATWAQHANHIHIAIAGALKTLGATLFQRIRKLRVNAPGIFGVIGNRSLDLARAASLSLLRTASGANTADGPVADVNADPDVISAFRRAITASHASRIEQQALWEAGIVESGLRNLRYGDADSLGALQERVSIYGAGQALDPFLSAMRFLRQVAALRPWRGTAGALAQAVQRSAFPGRYDQVADQARAYLARGGFAWGGAQANGGNYLVNRPTLFMAGEAGAELASFTPLRKKPNSDPLAAPAPRPDTAAARQVSSDNKKAAAEHDKRVAKALHDRLQALIDEAIKPILATLQIPSFADPAPVKAAIGRIFKTFAKIGTKSKNALDALSQGFDALLGDNSPFDKLAAAAQQRFDRAQRRLTQSQFSVTRSGQGTRNFDVTVADQRGLSNLVDLRGSLQGAEGQLGTAERQARTDLAAAKRSGNKSLTQRFQGALDKIRERREGLRQQLAENAQQIVEGQEQLQQDTLDRATRFFDAIKSGLDNARRRLVAKNDTANLGAIYDSQISAINLQIKSLTDQLKAATKSGNQVLAQQLRQQIDDLQTQIVEMTSEKLQSAIDVVNKTAAHQIAGNDIQQRLARLGVGLPGGIAALGRVNYGVLGQALQGRGQIIQDQRAGLQQQLQVAIDQGDVSHIKSLTEQIQDLDAQVVENTQAIRDNTDAAFADAVARRQGPLNSLLSINQAGQQINEGLGRLTGFFDRGTQGQLLQGRGGLLSTLESGDKGDFTNLINSVLPGLVNGGLLQSLHGNQLAPYLSSIVSQALGSGQFDDAQIQALESLATAILGDEQATVDNTEALKQLNGTVAQTFTTTAFSLFRQSIFNGNSGLLPQYKIPQMETGGYVLKGGLFELHAGEKVTPAKMVGDGTTIKELNVNITNPSEVYDPVVAGRRTGWEITRTTRR